MNNLKLENSVLLLVDWQQKLLPAMSGGAAALERAVLLARGAAALAVPTVVSEQYPAGLGATVPELRDVLAPGARVCEKFSFSCFGEIACATTLDETDRRTLVIAGVETHVCVAQTALDALNRGYEVMVVGDAVASRKPEDKAMALAMLRHAGAGVLSAEAVLFMWLATARHPDFKTIARLVK